MVKTSNPSGKSIPVTLVTGLLGSGKTSVIHQLFKHKPKHEQWGLIVNEFGDIGIDSVTLGLDTHSIETVTGGCLCCSAQFGYQQALQKLIKRPLDRILIEPTGLGHPAKTIDTLKQFAPHIQVAGNICVITPKQLTPIRWHKSAVMRDMVTLADTLLLNQIDLSTDTEIKQAREILHQIYPPKTHIHPTQFGQISVELSNRILDEKAPAQLFTVLQGLEQHADLNCQTHQSHTSKLPHCQTAKSQVGKVTSMGWIFDTQIQFNRNLLKAFITSLPHLIRAKGIIKTGNEWQLFNYTENSFAFSDIAWRQDSRLELILSNAQEFNLLESALSEVLVTRSTR